MGSWDKSVNQLCLTLCNSTHQVPLSMGFSRQEYWSGLPFPSQFPTQGLNPGLLSCRQILQCLSHKGNPGGMGTRYNQIPYSLGGWPTDRRTIIPEKFSQCCKGSESHIRLASWGSSKGGLGIPKASDFEGQRDLTAGVPQDRRKQRLHS